MFARHLAGALAWILVAVLLIGPWPQPIRPGRSLALVGGLILGLALFSALSSIWSSSVSLSLAEFERGIGYLGLFTASYLTMRTPKQREWFARGIGAGIAVICLLALGDRLIAGAGPVSEVVFNRLNYPLGYWNGDGIVFGSGSVLFVWFAANADRRWSRSGWLALAILAATALYLTYSRGGLAVATISLILLFFLSPDRLKILVTTVIGVAAAVPLLLTIDAYPAISGTGSGAPEAGQSLLVVLVAVVGVALAATALEGLRLLARKRPETSAGLLAFSRDRRLLLSIAGTALATALVLVLAFGNNVWEQFSDGEVPTLRDPKDRFTEFSGSGRFEFNEVALDTFADHPLLGSGAGTYRFEWARERDVHVITQDAHSFYLEALSDLGLPGGLLAFALALSLVWLGALAWRRGRAREAPIVLAITAALLISFGFDWFWRLGATAALLLLFAAWIASAEAVEPWRRRATAGNGLKLAGLLSAWVAIVILAVPAVADRYVEASADSVRSGQVEKAIDQAHAASRLEPWNPDPHLQLAVIAEGRGNVDLALAELDRAIELEPENWTSRLIRFRINVREGRREQARADYERLREINPLTFGPFSFEEVAEFSP